MAKAKKLKSGNYRVLVPDYKDENGKWHYKSFTAKTKKEAIDKQEEMRDLLSKKYDLSSFTDDNGFDL